MNRKKTFLLWFDISSGIRACGKTLVGSIVVVFPCWHPGLPGRAVGTGTRRRREPFSDSGRLTFVSAVGYSGLEVIVKENESLERALRRFKRKVQRSGLYSELRKRRFYEKPSAQRKRKREAAIRRERRRQRRVRR